MTCGEFKAMDDAGRMGAAHELMHWIADAANFEASAPLKRYFEDSPEKAELMDDRLSDAADKGFTHNGTGFAKRSGDFDAAAMF